MFLQASKEGEQALISTVMKYMGQTVGKVADLFCGIGTFTYPLVRHGCRVYACDVNENLLRAFQNAVNAQMMHQVTICKRNLFKYPPEASELADFDAVLFDPPRAGASAVVAELAKVCSPALQKIIAVSCNPHSFVNDAAVLIRAGYRLEKITMIDQFVYSNHSELVALFTK